MIKKIVVLAPRELSVVSSAIWNGESHCNEGDKTTQPDRRMADADAEAIYSLLLGRLAECSDASLTALCEMTCSELRRRGLPVPRRRNRPSAASPE